MKRKCNGIMQSDHHNDIEICHLSEVLIVVS